MLIFIQNIAYRAIISTFLIVFPTALWAMSCAPLTEADVDILFKGVVLDIKTLKSMDPDVEMDASDEAMMVSVDDIRKGEALLTPLFIETVDKSGDKAVITFSNRDTWGGPYITVGETRWFAPTVDSDDPSTLTLDACALHATFAE